MTNTEISERELRKIRQQILKQFERINAIRTEKLTVLGVARDAALDADREQGALLKAIESCPDSQLMENAGDQAEYQIESLVESRPAKQVGDQEQTSVAAKFSVDFVLFS